jgi:hypothetical protein
LIVNIIFQYRLIIIKNGGIQMQTREKVTDLPEMLTIRQVSERGVLPEHAIRVLVKQKKIPAIFIGNKALINYDLLLKKLNALESD